MGTVSKKVLREMITGGDLRTAEDLQSYLKELFKDTLQEMLDVTRQIIPPQKSQIKYT